MVLLQPKLNLKVSQKQILTPGLVQMVSVLALNKLELKDMINAEMVENPVLEELDSSVPLLDDVAGKQETRDRELPGGSVEMLDRRGTAAADRAIASWWPPDLQPGEYVLRITVTGAAAEASSSVRFVVE